MTITHSHTRLPAVDQIVLRYAQYPYDWEQIRRRTFGIEFLYTIGLWCPDWLPDTKKKQIFIG